MFVNKLALFLSLLYTKRKYFAYFGVFLSNINACRPCCFLFVQIISRSFYAPAFRTEPYQGAVLSPG